MPLAAAISKVKPQISNIKIPLLLTSRLLLRPWHPSDLPAMATINASPAVMRYFPSTQTAEQTQAFITRQIAQQQERGYCYFAAETRHDARLVGFIGLSYQDYAAPFTPAVDIGWRLHPDVWRQGLATEGARACLDFAFTKLHVDRVVSVAILQNTPSTGVMEKIGMRRMGEFDHPALVDYPEIQRCVWHEKGKG